MLQAAKRFSNPSTSFAFFQLSFLPPILLSSSSQPTARVAVFMRGLGTFLDYPISIAKAWRPLAVEVLKEKDVVGVLA